MKAQSKLWAILIASIAILAIVFLSGCSAEKKLAKAITKAKNIAYQNPLQFADLCATLFPVKDSIVVQGKPIYIKADNKDQTLSIDSVIQAFISLKEVHERDSSKAATYYQIQLSSLEKQLYQLKKGYKPCVPDTVKLPGEIRYRENTASLAALKLKYDTQRDQLTKVEQERDSLKTTRTWLLIAGLVLLLGVGFLIFVIAKTK